MYYYRKDSERICLYKSSYRWGVSEDTQKYIIITQSSGKFFEVYDYDAFMFNYLFDYKIYNLNDDEYNKVKNGSHIKIDSNEDKLLLYYNNEEVAIYKKKDEFYVCDIMLI